MGYSFSGKSADEIIEDLDKGNVPGGRGGDAFEVAAAAIQAAVARENQRNYAGLIKFQKREGHLHVPTGHVEDGVTLWRWVANQQRSYASGKMARYPERIKRLEAVPGWGWRAPRGPQTQAAEAHQAARKVATPMQDRAVKALEHAGRPMGPSALYEYILAEGLDDPPRSANALGGNLYLAERAGRIKKVDGVYAPLSCQTKSV